MNPVEKLIKRYRQVERSVIQMGNCGKCAAGVLGGSEADIGVDDSLEIFESGKAVIASCFGVHRFERVRWFFHENPDIWGNNYGYELCGDSACAYGLAGCELTMGELINHWEGVAKRWDESRWVKFNKEENAR